LEQGYLVNRRLRSVWAFQAFRADLYFLVRAAFLSLFSSTQYGCSETRGHDGETVGDVHFVRKGLAEGVLERGGERLIAEVVLRDLWTSAR
jgi:hypothetical protein